MNVIWLCALCNLCVYVNQAQTTHHEPITLGPNPFLSAHYTWTRPITLKRVYIHASFRVLFLFTIGKNTLTHTNFRNTLSLGTGSHTHSFKLSAPLLFTYRLVIHDYVFCQLCGIMLLIRDRSCMYCIRMIF